MPSYDAVMEMITDKSKESVLFINDIGSEMKPEPVKTVGDVFFKPMGNAVLMIFVSKDTNAIVKQVFDPAKVAVLSARVNPID